MKQKLVLLALCLVIAMGAMAERKVVLLRVPDMECANCQGKVQKVLAYQKGVKDLSFDLHKRIVTVTFEDSKTTVEKLQAALIKELKYASKVVDSKAANSHSCSSNHHEGGCSSQSHAGGCSASCSQSVKPADKKATEQPKTGCSSTCGQKK